MEINFSDLFFTCSLIELIGRLTHQQRAAVVSLMGRKIIAHIYDHADVLHCEPIAKTADTFIEMCNIPKGDFDNISTCKYTVPDYWTIGKVYARFIQDITVDDVIDALFKAYNSPISDYISHYNGDFFYQSREYIKESYFYELDTQAHIKAGLPLHLP